MPRPQPAVAAALAVVFGCSAPRAVDIPSGVLPDESRWITALPISGGQITGPGTPLLPVTSSRAAVLADLELDARVVLAVYGPIFDPKDNRLRTSPVSVAKPGEIELPEPLAWIEGDTLAEEPAWIESEVRAKLTADWAPKCPTFPDSTAQISCAFCTPTVTQSGCSLLMSSGSCEAPLSLQIAPDGGMTNEGFDPSYGRCSPSEAAPGAVASVRCEGAIACQFDLIEKRPPGPAPFAILETSFDDLDLRDLSFKDGQLWVLGGTRTCGTSPSTLLQVSLDDLRVVGSATTAPCLNSLADSGVSDTFLSFGSEPPRLAEIDTAGHVLRTRQVREDFAVPGVAKVDVPTHQIGVITSFLPRSVWRVGLINTQTFEDIVEDEIQGETYDLWFQDGEIQVLRASPDSIWRSDGTNVLLPCLQETAESIGAVPGEGGEITLLLEDPPSFAAVLPEGENSERCLALSEFGPDADSAAGVALARGNAIAFSTGKVTQVDTGESRLSFVDPSYPRFLPMTLPLGSGRVRKMIEREGRIAMLIGTHRLVVVGPVEL